MFEVEISLSSHSVSISKDSVLKVFLKGSQKFLRGSVLHRWLPVWPVSDLQLVQDC